MDNRPQRTVFRAVFLRVMSLLLGLLMGLVAAEFLVRTFAEDPAHPITKRLLVQNPGEAHYYCYPSNPHGEFRRPPDLSRGKWHLHTDTRVPVEFPTEKIAETPWCVEFRFSRQGLRDRDYPLKPPPGVRRIAGVGDSFAAGEGVPLALSLFKQLEAQLGPRYEVVNSALPALNAADEVELLQTTVTGLDCRRAIVVFIVNDIRLTPELEMRQHYINDLINIRPEHWELLGAQPWYARYSRLAQFAQRRFAMRRITRETIAWYRDCYDPRYNGANLESLREDLKKLASIEGCRCVLVLYPLMEGLENGYPLAGVHARVADMAREAGIPVLDLASTFAGHESSLLWVHPLDHHPNGTAHRLAAEAILAWLRREVPTFLSLTAD